MACAGIGDVARVGLAEQGERQAAHFGCRYRTFCKTMIILLYPFAALHKKSLTCLA